MSAAMADLRIPDLGEGVEEGTVIALLVRPGEHVAAGQSVLEIETDKVTLEIPAPRAGTVHEFCVSVDSLVHPGDVVLRMADDGDRVADLTNSHEMRAETGDGLAVVEVEKQGPVASADVIPAGPSARREARQLGVDIATIHGSGARGRIMTADVRAEVRQRLHAPPQATSAAAPDELPDLALFGALRREALTRIEIAAARNLSRSLASVPQAWVEHRADITTLERARRALRDAQPAGAAAITLSAIIAKVVAVAVVEYPRFNAAFDGVSNEIVYREYVNVGIAVDTPHGLVVPVLRDAAGLSITAIALELERLSEAARGRQLEPAELRGAGITVSNLGGLGVSAIQPLVNWPQAAILGVATARDEVVATDSRVATRRVLPLTLGFDHRVINGADAARFLSHIGALLAEPLQLALAI